MGKECAGAICYLHLILLREPEGGWLRLVIERYIIRQPAASNVGSLHTSGCVDGRFAWR